MAKELLDKIDNKFAYAKENVHSWIPFTIAETEQIKELITKSINEKEEVTERDSKGPVSKLSK